MSQKEREEKAKEFWKYYISSDTKFPFYRKQGLKLIENY